MWYYSTINNANENYQMNEELIFWQNHIARLYIKAANGENVRERIKNAEQELSILQDECE